MTYFTAEQMFERISDGDWQPVPGPTLDVLIAVMMGCTRSIDGADLLVAHYADSQMQSSCCACSPKLHSFSRGPGLSRNKVYSGYWPYSMEAADQLAREGFCIHRPHGDELGENERWKCIVGIGWKNGRSLGNAIGYHKSGPEAICLALLQLKTYKKATH